MQFIYSSNSKYINGGGKIKAAELLNNKFSDQWKSLAHELFHGYQRENMTSLTTVNAEVEAYTFQYMFGSSPLGNNSKEGNTRVRDKKIFRKVPIALISLRVPAVPPAYCQRNNRL